MTYLSLKSLHILSMVLLFGTGLGSAWYKWMADRNGDVQHIAVINRHVVLADWLFTTPTIILQPVTGMAMLSMAQIPWQTTWVSWSLLLYVVAGACWLPVVWLQIQMRDLSQQASKEQRELSPHYWVLARWWFWLGVPAFSAMILIVCLMVFKFSQE